MSKPGGPSRSERQAASRLAARSRQRILDDIERLCADAGVPPEVLAREASVPPSYLRRILAGKARPSLETYAKLAVPLGADLAARLYPNTGPTIRDRHQARILEHLLAIKQPRWRTHTEVGVTRPARGWIDAVFEDERAAAVVATEIESDIRRIEQVIRWGREKAESLPSWAGWQAVVDRAGHPPSIWQLLVIRRTRGNRAVAQDFARQLAAAFPAHPEDAIASLIGAPQWPGPTLVWADVRPGGVRLIPAR